MDSARKLLVQTPAPPGDRPSNARTTEIQFGGNEIDIILENGDAGIWYRFEEANWTRDDNDVCMDGSKVTVTGRELTVETPAGIFEDCIEVEYAPTACADAGIRREWWALGVGLVRRHVHNFAGLIEWDLVEYEAGRVEVTFTRGDFDANGTPNISDGVAELNWLFTGGAAPSCERAADVNGDGDINIADAVALLIFLFEGGDIPPEPFLACGPDPTHSEIDCESFAACQ